jgi:hypothetical protein
MQAAVALVWPHASCCLHRSTEIYQVRIRPFALLLALVAATASQAAAPLFFVDSPFDPPAITTIYTVDPATGVMTVRAQVGSEFTPLFGIAAVDGRTLYASGTDNSGPAAPERSKRAFS